MSLFELLSSLFSYIFTTIIYIFIYSIIRLIYMDIRQMSGEHVPVKKINRQKTDTDYELTSEEENDYVYEDDEREPEDYEEDDGDEYGYDESFGVLKLVDRNKYDFNVADEYILDKDMVIIGRGRGCDIQISDSFLSGKHIRMWFDGKRWFAVDMASRNGSFINGRRLEEREQKLKSGDVISIGSIKFELEV